MGWFSKRQEVLVENKIKNDLSLERNFPNWLRYDYDDYISQINKIKGRPDGRINFKLKNFPQNCDIELILPVFIETEDSTFSSSKEDYEELKNLNTYASNQNQDQLEYLIPLIFKINHDIKYFEKNPKKVNIPTIINLHSIFLTNFFNASLSPKNYSINCKEILKSGILIVLYDIRINLYNKDLEFRFPEIFIDDYLTFKKNADILKDIIEIQFPFITIHADGPEKVKINPLKYILQYKFKPYFYLGLGNKIHLTC